jgi:hypothetical protein
MPSPSHPQFEQASRETKFTAYEAFRYEILTVHLLLPFLGPLILLSSQFQPI